VGREADSELAIASVYAAIVTRDYPDTAIARGVVRLKQINAECKVALASLPRVM